MEYLDLGDVQMSISIEKLSAALATAQGQMESALKSSKNPHYKSDYADLESCWGVARGPLAANCLSVVQCPTATGKSVSVSTMILHISGQWIKSKITMDAKDALAQTVGACTTYGRRYGLSSMVGITQKGDDDDAESAMPGRDKDDNKITQPYTEQKSNYQAYVPKNNQRVSSFSAAPAPSPEVKNPSPKPMFNPAESTHVKYLVGWLNDRKEDKYLDKMMRKMAGRKGGDIEVVLNEVKAIDKNMNEQTFDDLANFKDADKDPIAL